VRELGGEANEPMPVPAMGWFSTCTDPQGNEFALWQTDTSTGSRAVRSFQPEFAGQQSWCGRAGGCSGWWERLGTVHDHLSAGGVLAGQDEQGARQDRRLGGIDSEPGDDRSD